MPECKVCHNHSSDQEELDSHIRKCVAEGSKAHMTIEASKSTKAGKAEAGLEGAVRQYIRDHRATGYKGVHVVYSGLNAELKVAGHDAKAVLAGMSTIVVIPCKGGAMAYLKEEAPERQATTTGVFKNLK